MQIDGNLDVKIWNSNLLPIENYKRETRSVFPLIFVTYNVPIVMYQLLYTCDVSDPNRTSYVRRGERNKYRLSESLCYRHAHAHAWDWYRHISLHDKSDNFHFISKHGDTLGICNQKNRLWQSRRSWQRLSGFIYLLPRRDLESSFVWKPWTKQSMMGSLKESCTSLMHFSFTQTSSVCSLQIREFQISFPLRFVSLRQCDFSADRSRDYLVAFLSRQLRRHFVSVKRFQATTRRLIDCSSSSDSPSRDL